MSARQDAEDRVAKVLSASSAQLESARKMEEELASENSDLQRQLADAREACTIAGARHACPPCLPASPARLACASPVSAALAHPIG